MHLANLIIENFRCFGAAGNHFETDFCPGLTALVGANDAGKTAIIDSLRFALGTSDQDRIRIEDTDFHTSGQDVRVICRFEGLGEKETRAFIEFLTHGPKLGDKPILFLHWICESNGEIRRGRPYRRMSWTSGQDGKGAEFSQDTRNLLQATYLRPLRDAEDALSAGRGSRLAQVLRQSNLIKTGDDFRSDLLLKDQKLSILGITNLLNELLGTQQGVKATRDKINDTLTALSLLGEGLKGAIRVSGATLPDDARLRELLEKLDLRLDGKGKLGLGSDNLLFMACELLLLSQEDHGNKLLLIEEPEAHLHAQRQLQVMKALRKQASENKIQIIVTTHSPNLSSAIDLENLILICNRRGFPLTVGKTLLDASDYRFLKRFIDSTKANLFFARGVLIVEGDAENILLPKIAELIGADLTENGVSIVNVGGIGLRRYARIFRRRKPESDGQIDIAVACLADMDVMPDCAPLILEMIEAGKPPPPRRRWKSKKDFADAKALEERRAAKCAKTDGESVRTFVSDEWTFEYDLALGPADKDSKHSATLAEDVWVAALLAEADDEINGNKVKTDEVEAAALVSFADLKKNANASDGSSVEEVIASRIYYKFAVEEVSKAIAAQYLSERFIKRRETLTAEQFRALLPKYLLGAIEYVTKVKART